MKKNTRYLATIAYDGTAYNGWQIQKNGLSIQALLQKAATTALREAIHFTGSGRTDAGVHALSQYAHFDTDTPFDPISLRGSLNGLLPDDIRVKEIKGVADDFHARFSAKGKTYYYNFCTHPVFDPFKRLYALHIPRGLHLDLIEEAIPFLVGKRDFTSFANLRGAGLDPEDRVRTLKRITPIVADGAFRLEFEGDGFLYKMVRNLVGLFLEISKGKIPPKNIADILNAKDRQAAPAAVPPQGLFLSEVFY